MAFTTSLDRPAASLGLRHRIAGKLRALRARREQYQEYYQILDTLSRASDSELAGLGIRRENITEIARNRAGL